MSDSKGGGVGRDDDDDGTRPPTVPPEDTEPKYGLPIDLDEAKTVTSSTEGLLGEVSKARSVGAVSFASSSFSAPPSLACGIGLEPPSLKEKPSHFDQPSFPKCSRKKTTPPPPFAVTSSAWNIPEGSIQPVPDHYPLEPRLSEFIVGSTPSEIASRVSDCLRRRSIAASYGDVKAKAKCKTEDGVEFRVKLYSGKGECGRDGVIIEIQRRSGWSVSFQQDCFAILKSAEGDDTKEKDGFDVLLSSSMTSMDTLLREAGLKGASSLVGEQRSWVARSLLVENERTDAKVIGLKGLCAITDTTEVGTEIALKNATAIIQDDGGEVREILMNFVIRNEISDASEDDGQGAADMDYCLLLRDLALKAMSNCVEVMTKEDVLRDATKKQPWLVDGLITILIDELREAEIKPNEAAVAAKCLSDLMSASSEASYKAIEQGAGVVLSKAKDIGKMLHANLERETRRGAEILECH